MSYVMLIIYSAMSANGWESTRLHQDFQSMKECQKVLADWQRALGNKIISAQCYYRSATPLPGDCKAWQQYSFKWTSHCLKPGNDVKLVCQDLANPPSPYDKCFK